MLVAQPSVVYLISVIRLCSTFRLICMVSPQGPVILENPSGFSIAPKFLGDRHRSSTSGPWCSSTSLSFVSCSSLDQSSNLSFIRSSAVPFPIMLHIKGQGGHLKYPPVFFRILRRRRKTPHWYPCKMHGCCPYDKCIPQWRRLLFVHLPARSLKDFDLSQPRHSSC